MEIAHMAPLEKKAQASGALMVFLDESGFSLIPMMPRTWAPRGETPILRHRMSWPKLSAIGAVAPNPHVWLRLVKGTVKSQDVIRFVRRLLRSCPRPIMLFLDGLGAHWSRQTRAAFDRLSDRLSVCRFPAYAPELNPAEGLYAQLKGHLLRGYCPPDLPALQRTIRRGIRHIRRHPNLIRACFHKTPLSF
jgi:transposase